MTATTRDNPVANNIAMVVIVLMALGTVFVFSASANISYKLDLQRFYDFPALRQILYFLVLSWDFLPGLLHIF